MTKPEIAERIRKTEEELAYLRKQLTEGDRLVEVNAGSIGGLLSPRRHGPHAWASVWLNGNFDWELKKDSYGELVLIPTRK